MRPRWYPGQTQWISPKQSIWDRRFMRIAQFEVADWSKDPRKKVGCVVVSSDRSRQSMGYNGFPRGVADTDNRLLSDRLKNMLMVHAEVNAILNSRTDLTGWTLYVTDATCTECAKAIIQAGIVRVVHAPILSRSSWSADQEFALGLMLEAGLLCSCLALEKSR